LKLYSGWRDDKSLKKFRFEQQDDLLTIEKYPDEALSYRDEILTAIYKKILQSHIEIQFDEDLGMNVMTVATINKGLSINICDMLIGKASDFFVESQTQLGREALGVAQSQTDSILTMLNRKEERLAELKDEDKYKIKATGIIEEERLYRDIELLNLMYGEAFSSLELAKYTLQDQTPVVEIIDYPAYSTFRAPSAKSRFLTIGAILGGFLSIIFLIFKRIVSETPGNK
jgi:capsule polysaccharide export protein KpsE/RkpR